MTLRHLYEQYSVNPDHVTYVVTANNGQDKNPYGLEIGLVGDKVIILHQLTDVQVELIYSRLGFREL